MAGLLAALGSTHHIIYDASAQPLDARPQPADSPALFTPPFPPAAVIGRQSKFHTINLPMASHRALLLALVLGAAASLAAAQVSASPGAMLSHNFTDEQVGGQARGCAGAREGRVT